MKKLISVGVVFILGIIAFAMYSAFDQGEKSPVYVEGEIILPEALRADAMGIQTLFIIVYDEASPMPMPFGAQKESVPVDLSKPIPYLVTKEALRTMNPDAPAPQMMRVKVRLDKDGVAGPDQPGDLTGEVTGVKFGTSRQTIEISKKAE